MINVLESGYTPEQHLHEGLQGRHHACREIILDYTAGALVGRAAVMDETVSILTLAENERLAWQTRLLAAREFFRLPSLLPQGGVTLSNRSERLFETLSYLVASGIVSPAALNPCMRRSLLDTVGIGRRNTVEFEAREYLGDNLWGSATNRRLMIMLPDRDWTSWEHAWGFGILRDNIESNDNLTATFDLLGLQRLLPATTPLTGEKAKADIIEGIVGDLYVTLWRVAPDAGAVARADGNANPEGLLGATTQGCRLTLVVQHALTELYDIIALAFMNRFSTTMVDAMRDVLTDGSFPSSVTDVAREKTPTPRTRRGGRLPTPRLHTTNQTPVDREARDIDVKSRSLLRFQAARKTKAEVNWDDLVQNTCGGIRQFFTDDEYVVWQGKEDVPSQVSARWAHDLASCRKINLAVSRVAFPRNVPVVDVNVELVPGMMSDDELMLMRMYPLNKPFDVNSGHVPDIVLRAAAVSAAKRQKDKGQALGTRKMGMNSRMFRRRR